VRADVVVVGAGCAGLSAATALAEAGLRVVVLEQAPRAGGRATAFVDRTTGERVDNGQHVLFGCYRETYAWLDRIGTSRLAPLEPRLSLSIAGPDGRAFTLRCPPLAPPWHLLAGLLRWRALSLRDRLSAARIRPVLAAARREGAAAVAARVPPSETVSAWLKRYGQSPRICAWLWHPLAIAALNQSPDTVAAQPFVRVLGELFGPRVEDSAVGLPIAPLDELFAVPAVRFVEAHGGAVMTSAPARLVVDATGRLQAVRTPTVEIEASAVVSAVPWHALARLWEPAVPPPLAALVRRASSMASSPIVTVNLWFDGPALGGPLLGLVGGPMHWAFDKAAIFGRPSGHLSVVASGAAELAARDNAEVTRLAMAQLCAAAPTLRGRRLRRSLVVREHRATFSLAPGVVERPPAETSLAWFHLAGDWTATGLPATIEGAVHSGQTAAALVLRRLGRAEDPRGRAIISR
jgi:squalene-associated FAD-dependent desaturase